jgi:hypothetical protein
VPLEAAPTQSFSGSLVQGDKSAQAAFGKLALQDLNDLAGFFGVLESDITGVLNHLRV